MKLPFSFSLKFVFRLLLPGFILSLATFPLLYTLLEQLNWLTLDSEVREEIDNQQALADSTIYAVTALNICSLICIIYALLKAINSLLLNRQIVNSQLIIIKNLPNEYLLLGLAIFAFISSYILYRFSLHIHATFGEIFKSVFDDYRKNISIDDLIKEVSSVIQDNTITNLSKKEQYKIAWRYLHNYRIKQNGKILRPSEINPQSDS